LQDRGIDFDELRAASGQPEHGTAQFAIPDVLKVPPISERGNVIEIAQFFGGPEKLKEAVNELQTLLYAA